MRLPQSPFGPLAPCRDVCPPTPGQPESAVGRTRTADAAAPVTRMRGLATPANHPSDPRAPGGSGERGDLAPRTRGAGHRCGRETQRAGAVWSASLRSHTRQASPRSHGDSGTWMRSWRSTGSTCRRKNSCQRGALAISWDRPVTVSGPGIVAGPVPAAALALRTVFRGRALGPLSSEDFSRR
jgi:hypothetical protein